MTDRNAPPARWYRQGAKLSCLLLSLCWTSGCNDCRSRQTAEGPRLVAEATDQACPHPWFPLVEGGQWTYVLSQSATAPQTAATLRVLSVQQDGSSRRAKVRRVVGASETTVEAGCNEEGTDFLSLFVPLGPPLPIRLGYAPTITERSGTLLPPPARIRPEAEWSYSLVAHTERPGGHDLTMDSQWNVKARFLGRRTVTVPAGRYEASQIRFEVAGHHRPPEQKQVVLSEALMDPPAMAFTYSLAPGVGVVLIEGEPPQDRPDIRPRWALTGVSSTTQ